MEVLSLVFFGNVGRGLDEVDRVIDCTSHQTRRYVYTMKDKQINVRLSMEDVRRLKELAAPFGGISNWIRAVLDSGVTGSDERSLVHVPQRPGLSTHLKGW